MLINENRIHQDDPPGFQVFNSSGIFIVPFGYTQVFICMCGGGGAGGRGSGSGGAAMGGGGGGSGVIRTLVAVNAFESINVNIAPAHLKESVPPSGSTEQAASSSFEASSGTIIAIGGFSGENNSANQEGQGVNGGGFGGKPGGDVLLHAGKPCTSTCDGIDFNGGCVGFSPALRSGCGGGGGYGEGAPIGVDAPNNSGAGGAGGGIAEQYGTDGGSGKCVVYWGGTEP